MKMDFESLLQLEQASANSGTALAILTDLKTVLTPPLRLMYLAFEQDNWDVGSVGGMHLAAGLLKTLADSKIVEDLHSVVRVQRNSQKTRNKPCTKSKSW